MQMYEFLRCQVELCDWCGLPPLGLRADQLLLRSVSAVAPDLLFLATR